MRARIALLVLGMAAAAALAPRRVRLESNAGGYWIEHELDGALALNESFALEVRVFDSADAAEPAAGVALEFDARMPQHRHGMRVEPTVTRLAPGRFRVEGARLHMPGLWELYFDVTRGAVSERAQVSLELE